VYSIITALIILVADQLTKLAVVREVGLCERIPVLDDFVRITHIKNSGAVFGIMKGAGAYFTFFSVVAAGVLIIVLFFSRKTTALAKIALGLVLGGAVGNLVDRLRFGAVVDFMDIGINQRVRWPSFNVADLAITLGVVFLVVKTLRASPHTVPHEGD
jgi:signal peptidase II